MGMRKFALAIAAVLLAGALGRIDHQVEALPPAGVDRLPVVVTADVTSRLGNERVVFTGQAEITREAPHTEGGVEVSDFSVTDMDLTGASQVGAISTMPPSSIGLLGGVSHTANTGGDGNGFETSPTQAFVNDSFPSVGVAAQDYNSGTSTSTSCTDAGKDRHRFWGFETALPPTAVIEGIEVKLDAWSDATVGGPFMCVELSWDGGATWTAPQSTTTLGTTPSTRTLGGTTNTWGRQWTRDELSKSNFRVRVTNVASDNTRDFFLDFVGINIYYSAPSPGEIRANQAGQDFPASSFIDLYAAVQVPITFPGGNSIVLHNNEAFHLTPRSGGQEVDLNEWPPLGVTYALDPVNGVDNDGDTQVDEDTPDEDGDLLVDEDRPGLDPDTPGSGGECPTAGGPDCDSAEGEDPPEDWCIQNSSSICDDDGDGQRDEDPSCIPMLGPANHNSLKLGLCVRNLTMQFAPELPSFSVAPGGPSDLHPADILGMTPGAAAPPPPPSDPLTLLMCSDDLAPNNVRSQVTFSATAGTTYRIQVGSWSTTPGGNLMLEAFSGAPGSPTPVAVSGNDNFESAHVIPSLPHRMTESTIAATTQPNEPLNQPTCPMGGRTVWFSYTPASSGSVTLRTSLDTDGDGSVDEDDPDGFADGMDDDGDTEVDEDQPESNFDTVLAVYTGSSFPSGGGGGGGGEDTAPPIVRIRCSNLGLTTDGCDTGADGDQDDLDALSYGDDVFTGTSNRINFSVGPGAQGLPGTAVRTQANCPSPEPEPDEFSSALDDSNTLVMDGNGPVGTCTSAFPFGFVESATERDNLDALHDKDPTSVDPNLDGIPSSPVYFSLASGSPSLTSLGASAASILRTVNGATPTVYASPAALGLQTGDDIDALCLAESGDGVFNSNDDQIYFSLAPGSPSLAALGAGPGDLLQPGSPASVVEGGTAGDLGLASGDNLDAIKCLSTFSKDPNGDTDGDTVPNLQDTDDDNDGCTDEQELGSVVGQGGRRNPHNFWDFFDTPLPGASTRDKAVTTGDVFRVVARFGTNDANGTAPINRNTDPLSSTPMTGYHPAYDRTPQGPNNWNLGPADGTIATQDIVLSTFQFGHTCMQVGG